MSEKVIKLSYTRDEVFQFVKRLNLTYSEGFQWKNKKAQKQHIDLFGKVVSPGQQYWRLSMGLGFINDLKLSESSMERFLFALFAPYPKWEQETTTYVKDQMRLVRNIIDDHLRPVSKPKNK